MNRISIKENTNEGFLQIRFKAGKKERKEEYC